MIVLFQQFPIFIPFQHLHLLNGYLIEFDKTFSLWHSVIDQYGIDILHIREADEFVNGSIITDIPFQLRNSRGLSPRVHFCFEYESEYEMWEHFLLLLGERVRPAGCPHAHEGIYELTACQSVVPSHDVINIAGTLPSSGAARPRPCAPVQSVSLFRS